jgi:hypothetical protein
MQQLSLAHPIPAPCVLKIVPSCHTLNAQDDGIEITFARCGLHTQMPLLPTDTHRYCPWFNQPAGQTVWR